MNTAQPIRNPEELQRFKHYYMCEKHNPRNQLLIILGLNTALRISDILVLRWGNVYDFKNECFRSHISIVEQKTGKRSRIYMNESIMETLCCYKEMAERATSVSETDFLIQGRDGDSLSRSQAWRIIRNAAEKCNIPGVVSPHSLRKTFGYLAWKNGTTPTMLMDIFNHSSFDVTQRYLGIEQEDRDEVFRSICI